MYQNISLVLYFTTLIACLSLAILFKLSKAGPFRNQFLWFFLALSWVFCSRFLAVSGIVPIDLIYVILPLCLASIWLVWSITNYHEDSND